MHCVFCTRSLFRNLTLESWTQDDPGSESPEFDRLTNPSQAFMKAKVPSTRKARVWAVRDQPNGTFLEKEQHQAVPASLRTNIPSPALSEQGRHAVSSYFLLGEIRHLASKYL